MSELTRVVSAPFKVRWRARIVERRIQWMLDAKMEHNTIHLRTGYKIPTWAKGVRVEKAGLFQYVLVATTRKGH